MSYNIAWKRAGWWDKQAHKKTQAGGDFRRSLVQPLAQSRSALRSNQVAQGLIHDADMTGWYLEGD